ncbi:MAG: hypothetical protein A3K18_08155 [Lentisphaerae bacterium RIFOXYA12_64_32]|nr:MAG: hypothetical protein A3K18_08155 [Lentisphaerae bacterium RIFOXYA12_64_32]
MTRKELAIVTDQQAILIDSGTGWQLRRSHAAIETDRGTVAADSATANAGVECTFHTQRLGPHAVEFWQTLANRAPQPLCVRRITLLDGLLKFTGAAWDLVHGELFRCERYFGGFTMLPNRFRESVDRFEGTLGLSEDTPFPALLFTHRERGTVLIGVLSQDRCKPAWTFTRADGALRLAAADCFSGIPTIPVAAGATFSSERWVVLATPGSAVDAIDAYFELLRQRLGFLGRDSVLREEAAWGSWNYNVRPAGHGDVTHDYIVANARALKDFHPKARWVMIDDGYQVDRCRRKAFYGIEIVSPAYATPHEPSRFPHGMKATADAIRAAGLKPALWSTPCIDGGGPFAAQHPDWLLKLKDGHQFLPGSGHLDYSIPEAREFTRRAWQTIFHDWGYQGLKCDFWTTAFELPEIEFRNTDRTAIELRNLFLKDIQELVPAGGYLLTCCTTNTGNPFLGMHAQASRAGNDVGDGNWQQLWSAAVMATGFSVFYRGDCLLADADSFGWCPNLDAVGNRLWATLTLVTGGMCEIGGDIAALSPDGAKLLRTGLDFFGPVAKAVSNVLDGGTDAMPASDWRVERPDGVFGARFNWQDYPRPLRLARPVVDLWTGQTFGNGTLLPRHSAILFRE